MRKRLFDTARLTTSAYAEPLHDNRFADISFSNDQRVNIEIMIVLCVGDSRFERLLHRPCDPLARERQIGERRINFLAANHRRYKIELLRAEAKRTGD